MTQNDKRVRRPIDRLANLLVEDILATSDEEILAECREEGGDPDRDAAEVKALFEKSLLLSNKSRLAAAKAAVAESKRTAGTSTRRMIDMVAARRRLHEALTRPNLPQPVTLAARKESELSDADVLGLLADLEELGLLPRD